MRSDPYYAIFTMVLLLVRGDRTRIDPGGDLRGPIWDPPSWAGGDRACLHRFGRPRPAETDLMGYEHPPQS